jgi:membrane carboxypeptidase/penicillin-binding protein PbpC
LDINGNVDAEQRNIEAYTKHGKINQQWDLVYADEWKGEPGPGELNEEFGLVVERTFYIVSALDGGRYLDLINNRNMVIKTRNGRNTQQWYFDQKSLTIKTRLNNQSWDIKSSGKTNNMQIWSTNSGWW